MGLSPRVAAREPARTTVERRRDERLKATAKLTDKQRRKTPARGRERTETKSGVPATLRPNARTPEPIPPPKESRAGPYLPSLQVEPLMVPVSRPKV